jgi:hypothetical protein
VTDTPTSPAITGPAQIPNSTTARIFVIIRSFTSMLARPAAAAVTIALIMYGLTLSRTCDAKLVAAAPTPTSTECRPLGAPDSLCDTLRRDYLTQLSFLHVSINDADAGLKHHGMSAGLIGFAEASVGTTESMCMVGGAACEAYLSRIGN